MAALVTDGSHGLRTLYSKSGINRQASGSAYLEHDRTKVICSVFGPQAQVRGGGYYSDDVGLLSCDVKFAPFATRERRQERGQTSQEKEMSTALRGALEPAVMLDRFPKAVVEVFVLVLEADGGELGVAISCAALALANAGIEMYDLVAGCSVAKVRVPSAAAATTEGRLVLDPTAETCQDAAATLHLALMPSSRQLTHVQQCGEMDVPEVASATELCLEGCAQISNLLAGSLKQGDS